MAVSIDWGNTNVISIPKADLTFVSGDLYELDTDAFRLELKALEASEEGMPFPVTHAHTTEYTVAGVTYARAVQILPPYSVEFEDGAYSVRLTGSNNNIFDAENGILVRNQVQIIGQNAAGLVVVAGGGSWQEEIEPGYTAEELLKVMAAVLSGKSTVVNNGDGTKTVKFRDVNDTKDRVEAEIENSERTSVTIDPS